jgi:galactose-1-phosphate uridylyltransferase
LSFVTDENIDKEAKDKKKQVKEPTKVYAPKIDVMVGIDKEKEIINVEVDNDDEEARLMQFLEKAPSQPVENFQVQLSKGQKRTQKKLNQSSKDSYQTRSKVSLKPFK